MAEFCAKVKAVLCCQKKEKNDDDVIGGVVETAEPSPTQRRLQAWERHFRPFLPWVPFTLLLCIANSEPYAACWTAFGVSVALNLNDFLQARLAGGVEHGALFPTTINFTSLVVYILLIIVVNQNAKLDPKFVGPIAVTFITAGVFFSIIFSRPLSAETTGLVVAQEVRASMDFLKFNQFLTVYVFMWFALMLVCVWVGTIGELGNAVQVVLGIVVPVFIPIVIWMTAPSVAEGIKKHAEARANDPDREGLLYKQGDEEEDLEKQVDDLVKQ